MLLVSAADPWARRSRVSVADLAGRDLVVRERGSITREVFEARIKGARIKTGQIFDVATREAVQEAVAAGFRHRHRIHQRGWEGYEVEDHPHC